MNNDDWWKSYFSKEYYRMMILRNKDAAKQVKFILDNINISHNIDILDMCCGYGRHSFEFSNFGHTVLGVDYSKQLINIAKKKLKNNDKVDFVVKDIRYYDSLKKFDLVVCLFVSLGYFNNEDNERSLRNLCSSVKQNGYLVLELYNPNTIENNIQKSFNNSKYIQTNRWYSHRIKEYISKEP